MISTAYEPTRANINAFLVYLNSYIIIVQNMHELVF